MFVLKGRVIDGNGGAPIEKGVVAVEDNKIVAVCREYEYHIPNGAEVIEVKNGSILPGLFDLHVHLALSSNFYEVYTTHPYQAVCTAVNDMKKLLNAGFTSIRTCGDLSNYLKKPWADGTISGPRIYSSGKCFVQTGGHFDFIKEYPVEYTMHPDRNTVSQVVDGITEIRRESRRHFREGCDFLKVMITPGGVSQSHKFAVQEFSDEEIRTFVEEADKYGTYVAVHAHANVGIKAALRCGVQCIVHASYMEERDAEEMAKRGVWYVPTLSTGYQFMQNLDVIQPWIKQKIVGCHEAQKNTIKLARKYGIFMGCGADFGGDAINPHGMNGLELKLMCEFGGLTPLEAITVATKNSARFVQREHELGTLEEGKVADIIVVDGDPSADISLLVGPDHVKVVMQDGKIKKQIA